MRMPSSDLYELIQTLNKEEKKQVTLHLKILGKKGIEHLRLFNEIARQKEYNEKVLKQSFKTTNFSISKKRLYDLILKALLHFYADKDVDNQLISGLQIYKLLFGKGLYEKARKQVHELKTLALKHEKLNYLLLIEHAILQIEHRKFLFNDFNEEKLNGLNRAIEEHLQKIVNFWSYVQIENKVLFLEKKEKNKITKLGALDILVENPLMKNIDAAISNRAKLKYCNNKLIYYANKHDFTKILEYALEALKIFEQHFRVCNPPQNYLARLVNTMNAATICSQYDLVDQLIQKIDDCLKLVTYNQPFYKNIVLGTKSGWYTNIGDIKKGMELVHENALWIFENRGEAILSCFRFSCICFMAGEYEDALRYIDYVINRETKTYPNAKYAGKLLQLLIYYEMGTIDLLESLIRSLYRKLQPDKDSYQTEILIIGSIKKLIQCNDRAAKTIFRDLYEKLNILKEEKNETLLIVLSFFNYIVWVESKIKNVEMATLLSERKVTQ